MDLLDFDGSGLYFDQPLPPAVATLLDAASEAYGQGGAEALLLQAEMLAPESYEVLVGLYRFYYYQHRPVEALDVAWRVMEIAGRQLGLPASWEALEVSHLEKPARESLGLLRFYLLALKGAGYLSLRAGDFGTGKSVLLKLSVLDPDNRFGGRVLLDVLAAHVADVIPFPVPVQREVAP